MKANKVMLLGRMVKDVELNNYGKGKNAGVWCNFSLAVNDGTDSEGAHLPSGYDGYRGDRYRRSDRHRMQYAPVV